MRQILSFTGALASVSLASTSLGCGGSTARSAPVAAGAPAPNLELTRADDDPGTAMVAILTAHNQARAAHCSPPLAWSDGLAAEAAAWAEQLVSQGCAFEHSRTSHGENLAAGTSGALDADAVVAMWMDEVSHYDFSAPGFAMDTGHFTQVVWRTTTQLGCAMRQCDGLDVWVCNYDPAGNVEGEYVDNVEPTGCR